MKRLFSLALRAGVSGFLLWLLFRDERFSSQVLPHLKLMDSHRGWAIAGIASAGLALILAAVRLWVILRSQALPVGGWMVLRTTLVACFFNITSLGEAGGDAYKMIALSRHCATRKIAILISLIVDHLTGFAALVLLFPIFGLACSAHWSSCSPEIRSVLRGFSFYVIGATLFLVFFSCVSLSTRLLTAARRRSPRFMERPMVKHFVTTCEALRGTWRSAVLAVLISMVMLFFFFFSFYCGLRAVGGNAPLTDVLAAMPVVDLMTSLPISISGLGVREKTFESLLAAFCGLPEAVGISASLAGWLFNIFFGLMGGVIFLLRGSLQKAPVAGNTTA